VLQLFFLEFPLGYAEIVLIPRFGSGPVPSVLPPKSRRAVSSPTDTFLADSYSPFSLMRADQSRSDPEVLSFPKGFLSS